MFILYGVLAGVVIGLLLGGNGARLSEVRFHWKPLVFAGLAFQIVLFSEAVATRIGDLGPWLYVLSTGAVLAAVARNMSITGLPMVVVGGASNLIAIVANGGYMPAGLEAMAALGKAPPEGYSNSVLATNPALQPLTDIFALPAWLPFANVFSIGDVFIGVGVAWAIVAAMHNARFSAAGLQRMPGDLLAGWDRRRRARDAQR